MNEYEQALWNIRVSKPANKLNAEIIALQELVERATPKKIVYSEIHDFNICPNCGGNVYHHQHTNNCGDCGQTLDWSDK
jgi:ribosomal protein S27AE